MKRASAEPPSAAQIVEMLRHAGNPQDLAGMARFGIDVSDCFGVHVPQLRKMARAVGRNQSLAEELWSTGIHDARLLASLVGDPAKITRATMDRWAADFCSWDLCDACSCNLFDRTPWAWQKVRKWSKDEREFVRRAAFSIIAALTIHDKAAPDSVFEDTLPLIEQYAFDNRNYVRKAVNWALRNIGKRNPALMKKAIACGERIHRQGTPPARWIAADALRELRARV